MARQQHYKTPSHRLGQTPRVASAFKSLPRSPIVSKIQLANRSRFQPRNANTNRYLSYRTKLDAIKEEEEEECRQTRDLYRELDAYRDGSGIGHQDEDDEMAWDDETTLVAMLEDKNSEQQDREELAAIADKLKASMASCGPGMKRYLGDTLVPTVSHLRQVHAILEDDVDISFGTGLLAFDKVSKGIEAMALQDEDDTKNTFLEVKKNIAVTLERLKAAEAEREQLWTGFEQNVNEYSDRLTSTLNSMPKNIEQTISYLEKRSKELNKDDGSLEKLKAIFLQKR